MANHGQPVGASSDVGASFASFGATLRDLKDPQRASDGQSSSASRCLASASDAHTFGTFDTFDTFESVGTLPRAPPVRVAWSADIGRGALLFLSATRAVFRRQVLSGHAARP
ncbi:hypothetical protein C2857_001437 [Epichloe festucae Fl1]|uniref:Uncharacterized protein n=1 Tax=Epichloe festucae (strain Fl1) TaxID=877507 RepID=A0A7S9PWE5_EPIFF|nr:hypothetical protein C2857_001437 [Epichloe festucae Fl1]